MSIDQREWKTAADQYLLANQPFPKDKELLEYLPYGERADDNMRGEEVPKTALYDLLKRRAEDNEKQRD